VNGLATQQHRRGCKSFAEHRYRKTRASEYVCTVWFERDRANICLGTPAGRPVFDIWDEDVFEAMKDGFLTAPRAPRPSNDDWQPHAVAYAIAMGLIQADS
jgi:hypothetical protein